MTPAAATMMSAAIALAGRGIAAGRGRGKGGKFLRQLLRATMRTLGILPVGRADEDLAVALTLFTMKFVDGHEGIYSETPNFQAVKLKDRSSATSATENSPQFQLRAIFGRRSATLLRGSAALPNHGASFSRCGRWSRFQRLKAASLVSSKRNFSVGDSTWPSQNTTLARPW